MTNVDENWYHQAQESLTRAATAVQEQRTVDLNELARLAEGIVRSLQRTDQLVVEALSSPPGSPLITNLVNVSILATKVGLGLEYHGQELERLALAGLVHDIGIFAVPQSLLTKSARLTTDERALIERHPELGCRVVEQAGDAYRWLSPIVLQAHERWAGQGYPSRLKGRQIAEFAQIIGVVDVFDALVSPRPYRKRLLPHEAIHELVVVERTAFPREAIRALVEQLSVYPLGTIVRLTTGENGVVTRVNPRYPFRPVVRVEASSKDQMRGSGRSMDLSLTPLVSVLEAVNGPAVERVTFTCCNEAHGNEPRLTKDASSQFPTLIESLDSIASAIQQVVETKSKGDHLDRSSSDSKQAAFSVRLSDSDSEFRKEVVGLFALEAREWLGQIQRALRKLEGMPPPHLQAKLVDIVLHGITNLARSAATVQLPAIEEMAIGLVPLLQTTGGQAFVPAEAQISSLQAGLERITAAVQELSIKSSQITPSELVLDSFTVSSTQKGPPQHADAGVSVETALQERKPAVAAGVPPILESLRSLQLARVRSLEPTRDVLQAVIQRAEYELNRGGGAVDVHMIERILQDLDALDQRLLDEVEMRVPAMLHTLSALRSEAEASGVSEERLMSVLREVEALYEIAKSVNASTIVLFLDGLRSFMTVAVYRKVTMAIRRLEAVESRLGVLIQMAAQWVDEGRIERAAIEQILPS